MQQRTLGNRTVSAIGLGGMPMSIEGRPDRERSIATIHAALDAGVTLIDTADAYHLHADEVGHNESLIAEALRSYGGDTVRRARRDQGRAPAPRRRLLDPGRPPRVPQGGRQGVRPAARRRRDRAVPVPPAGPDGPLRRLGRRARRAARRGRHPDGRDLQRDRRPDRRGAATCSAAGWSSRAEPVLAGVPLQPGELEHCAELGIAFLPWCPLGGISNARASSASRHAAFQRVADAHGVSVHAGRPSRGSSRSRPVVIPIPGASRPTSIQDSAARGRPRS